MEQFPEDERAGVDDPIGSPREGGAWVWPKVWKSPQLVLIGSSFSSTYSSSGACLRREFEVLPGES